MGKKAKQLATTQHLLRTKLVQCRREVGKLTQVVDLHITMLNGVDQLVMLIDLQGQPIYYNQASEKLIGYRLKESSHQSFWELLKPQEQESVKTGFGRSLMDKVAVTHESNWVALDGSNRCIVWTYTPFFNAENTIEYIIAIGNDITQCQQQEEELQKLREALARQLELTESAHKQEKAAQERTVELGCSNLALQQMIDTLASLSSFDKFIPTVLTIVAKTFKAANCGYYEHNQDETVYLRYWFSQGTVLNPMELQLLDPERHRTLYQLANGFTVPPEHLHGTTVRNRTRPVIIDHTRANTVPDFHAFAIAQGWELELNQPLLVEGKADGALVIYRSGNQPFSELEMMLAEALAKQLALAMQVSQLFTQVRDRAVENAIVKEQEKAATERAAELAKANESLRRSLDKLANERNLSSFIEHILQEALEMLDGALAQIFLYNPKSDTLTASVGVSRQGDFLPAPGLMNELPISQPFPANITGAWKRLLSQHGAIHFDLNRDADDFWPGTIEWHHSMGHHGAICIALIMGGQPLGMLGLAFQDRTEFTASEFEFFQALGQQATLAIQLTQLAEEAKLAAIAKEQEKAAFQRAVELATANDALKKSLDSLATKPSLDKFLGQVLIAIANQLKAPQVEYWYHQTDGSIYIGMMSRQGTTYSRDEIAELYPAHPGVVGADKPVEVGNEPLERNSQYFIRDNFNIPLFQQHSNHYALGLYQELNLPMLLGEANIGMLVIRVARERQITTQQVELAQALAHQATLAVQLTRLAEEAQQAAISREQEKAASERAAQLAKANTTLKKTLDVLATEPELDRALGHVLRVTTEQLGSSSAALWLFNSNLDIFSLHLVYHQNAIIAATPETAHQLAGQWTRNQYLPRDLALKTHIRERKPVIYDIAHSPEVTSSQRQFMTRLGVKTLLGVPLLLGSEIVGSFTVRFTEQRQFQAEELELTQALAHQSTLAVQLTRLAEAAQHEAKQAAILGERNRMARELHDTLAQTLTGIIMQLEATHEMIDTTASEAAQKHLTHAGLLARQGLQEARRSVWSLRPEALESRDLHMALLRMVQQMSDRTILQTEVIVDGTPTALPDEIETHLLRIGQESLTNAIKHAQAQKVQIKLRFAADAVQLQIVDDGQGLDLQQQASGFGIICMRERTQQMGGEFTLSSQIGQGTIVNVIIPTIQSKAEAL